MAPFWPFHIHRHNQHDYDKVICSSPSSSVSSGFPPLTTGRPSFSPSSSSPSSKSGVSGRKKSVSFAKLHQFKQLFKHIHISELSKAEIADAWYSQQELDVIRDEHQSSTIIRKKKVSFSPQVKQYDYVHVLDLSDDEICNAWYGSSELNEIHEENLETIQWMLNGCSDTAHIFCSRGLENKTPIGHRMRSFRRKESLQILKQQLEVCSEKLAEIYGRCTRQSAHLAWLAAKVDREHAIKYMACEAAATNSTRTPPMSPAAAA